MTPLVSRWKACSGIPDLGVSRRLPQAAAPVLRHPYLTLSCWRYIVRAHGGPDPHCGDAAGMWDGCHGQREVVAQFGSFSLINSTVLRAGDVLNFNGRRVAAFVSDGFMDSDPFAQRRGPNRSPLKGR
jgi:hypothetical protein